MDGQDRSTVRLAELLGVLSLVSDLGMGLPMEHALRQCLIAMRLADRLGLDREGRTCVFRAGLLAWVGCHVDAYEQAKWFGDDHAVKPRARDVDFSNTTSDVVFLLRYAGARGGLGHRMRSLARIARNMDQLDAILETHWRAVDDLATRLDLTDQERKTIEQTFERWDGRGAPYGAKGEEVLLTAQLVNLADVVEVFHRTGGVEAAVSVARERSGTQFDPELSALFGDVAQEVLGDLDDVEVWDAVMRTEPTLTEPMTDAALDEALEAIADFTDVKSPYTLGHSVAVADLAGDAAVGCGLSGDDVTLVRRAGLLHDLGRLGVSNNVWDKPGPLNVVEAERVRLHPYLTERTLAGTPALASLGAVAVQHHERLDGSGYPSGLSGEAITPAGRLLGAADTYRAKTEHRPHRPAETPSEAARLLRGEVRAGRLDGDAVEAVLRAAGHRPRRRLEAVAGLTAREIEVLRLVARGLSTKQVAEALGISRKTAANHTERVYAKIGVTNRALASLFAVRHGFVDPGEAL